MFHFLYLDAMKLRQMLLPAAVLLISLPISAQDLIYKKNGETVKAKILEASDQSLSYKRYKSVDSLTYFIKNQALDSIKYENGLKTIFKKVDAISQQYDTDQNSYNTHNLIGLDLAGYLFYRHLTLSYEYLPGKANLGFKAIFAKNIESVQYPLFVFNFSRIPDWSMRLGINYYFFPPRTFRFGTGLYYIFGKYSTANYYYFNESFTSTLPDRNMSGMILSLFGFYNFNKYLAFNLGLDTPLILNPTSSNFSIIIRCEILLNF